MYELADRWRHCEDAHACSHPACPSGIGLGATVPSHRGKGAQGALLARRIADANESGARATVTETGRPEPGEEAKHPSYRNILRAGFEEAYVRINYRPPAA